MLFDRQFDAPLILQERFINLYYLLEVQFLEVYVQSPDEEVNQVALFQFAASHAS